MNTNTQVKSEKKEKRYHTVTEKENVEVDKVKLNEADFKENIIRDKEDNFIMIKGSIHYEDIIILNIYAPNNRDSKCMKQNLIDFQGQIRNYSWRFLKCLSIIDRTSI